jgi:hypothetical protein
MPSTIETIIREEAEKLIRRFEIYATNLAADIRRKEARSGLEIKTKSVLRPSCWSIASGFDPYYVRRHAPAIARSIERSLSNRTYAPRRAFRRDVTKADGSLRTVSNFQVADSAISKLVFGRLLDKNARHFSANSYAYRRDLSIHDAISHIGSEVNRRSRLFVAEFDFKKYFDTIAHSHVMRMLGDRRFYVTSRERFIIQQFLATPTLAAHEYSSPHLPKTVGIPQGTSISLFLANLAAFPLDMRLERLGVGFARFADDTLIWAETYADIGRAANALEEAAYEMGVSLNFIKSKGVTLFGPPDMPAEIPSQDHLDFLGYSVGNNSLRIKKSAVVRIKEKLSFLVYVNLLQEPKRGHFPSERTLYGIDKDYPVLIYQMRRYLYGGMTEAQLRRFLRRQTPSLKFKGLMSFYPIVNDEEQLAELDGWLLATVIRALKLRERLWSKYYPGAMPIPHGLSGPQLLQLKHNSGKGPLLDLRFPSFQRISRLLRRASTTYGTSRVANARSGQYYSQGGNIKLTG